MSVFSRNLLMASSQQQSTISHLVLPLLDPNSALYAVFVDISDPTSMSISGHHQVSTTSASIMYPSLISDVNRKIVYASDGQESGTIRAIDVSDMTNTRSLWTRTNIDYPSVLAHDNDKGVIYATGRTGGQFGSYDQLVSLNRVTGATVGSLDLSSYISTNQGTYSATPIEGGERLVVVTHGGTTAGTSTIVIVDTSDPANMTVSDTALDQAGNPASFETNGAVWDAGSEIFWFCADDSTNSVHGAYGLTKSGTSFTNSYTLNMYDVSSIASPKCIVQDTADDFIVLSNEFSSWRVFDVTTPSAPSTLYTSSGVGITTMSYDPATKYIFGAEAWNKFVSVDMSAPSSPATYTLVPSAPYSNWNGQAINRSFECTLV